YAGLAGGGALIVIAMPLPAAPGQHVEIDLGGWVVSNAANPGAPVITFLGPAPAEVVVRNGTLIGGSDGILAGGGARKVVVEDVQVGNAVMSGIHLSGPENFIIRRCVISTITGGPGILVDNPGAPTGWQGTIEDT